MPAAYKGAAIVNPHGDASAVTNLNERAELQRAMRRRHTGAIQTLAIRRATTAKTVGSSVDACNFCIRDAANREPCRSILMQMWK
jgi:hypothetical protein